MSKISIIIFDLDDTLYDTSNRLPGDNSPNFAEMKLFPDVRDALLSLRQKKILLTQGAEDIQRKKIEILGIFDLFDEIIIVPNSEAKIPVLEKISREYDAETVMVVGDRCDKEIRYGNTLGFVTVRVPGFKYRNTPFETDLDKATHDVEKISDILSLLD